MEGEHEGGPLAAGGKTETRSALNGSSSLEPFLTSKVEKKRKRTSELMDSSARVFLPERSVMETKMGAIVRFVRRFGALCADRRTDESETKRDALPFGLR